MESEDSLGGDHIGIEGNISEWVIKNLGYLLGCQQEIIIFLFINVGFSVRIPAGGNGRNLKIIYSGLV